MAFSSAAPLRRPWLVQLYWAAERSARTIHTGNTRGAMAATSRNVRQKLVDLLFREQYGKTGPEGHRRLDFSIYSYEDLRKAYLERLQVIHPDKVRHASTNDHYNNSTNQREALKNEFQELQSTWDQYEELSRNMTKVQGDGMEANFTKFGVGCSFSDSDEERALRSEITDQACRGWFSSGLLQAETDHRTISMPKEKPLVDESLFVSVTEEPSVPDSKHLDTRIDERRSSSHRRNRRTLIPGIN